MVKDQDSHVSATSNNSTKDDPRVNYPMNYIQESARCIIRILSNISSRKSSLLDAFCTSFLKDCLDIFLQEDNLQKSSAQIERIDHFLLLLDQHSVQKNETWSVDCMAGPLFVKSFPSIKCLIKGAAFADDNFSITVNKSALEIIATYKKEETGMDLVIHLPSCYPLRPVDVDCTRSLGVSEVKQRKWLLSLTAFVCNQNGAIAEAIRTWKNNLDREFDGVEECPICYSIIHTTNHSLHRLACKTCKHKFHSACLYKWFSTSHKSTCPLCQTPF